MKIRRTINVVSVDLSRAEAHVLLKELLDVRGGSRLPKVRQLCRDLEFGLKLDVMAPEIAEIPERKSS